MRSMTKISWAIAAAVLMTGSAWAKPEMDAAGKCRDNGKFVKQEACATVAPAPAKCRDIKSKKFAKCGTAGTEPVPEAKTQTK